MKFGFSRSLRLKLIGIVLLTTLSALVVALIAIIVYDLRIYQQNWIADVSTQAELLGQTSASAIAFDDPRVAKENLELLRLRPHVQAAAIYTANGALFATYVRPGASEEFPKLPEADGMRTVGRELVLYRRIVNDKEILGTVYLRTDYEMLQRIRDYVGIALAVAGIAMLVALFMSAQLQRVVTDPVLAIAGIAREVVQQQDYSRRATKMSDDEVGVLVDSFNGMLAEIERRTGELEVSNVELERQVAERSRAEQEILRLNTELEARVRERTAQLESANHELEAFCFSVSHDLRAPLRAIDGFSQALLEDFPKDVPEEAQRYLSRIRASTLRMGQLIEDLLNLSRVSRGTLERTETDLSELARQIVAVVRQHDPGRSVDISIWDGMSVQADHRLLRAALENLIANAWKFTSKTEYPRIEIGVLRDGRHQVFFVRDNGAGFNMAYVDKLFSPFQRLHSAAEYAGTGIGLATVQRIVFRHGGRIWADAKVDKGAAFYFTLTADDAPQTNSAQPAEHFSGARIDAEGNRSEPAAKDTNGVASHRDARG
jgi:signal transduction histidine kinase